MNYRLKQEKCSGIIFMHNYTVHVYELQEASHCVYAANEN